MCVLGREPGDNRVHTWGMCQQQEDSVGIDGHVKDDYTFEREPDHMRRKTEMRTKDYWKNKVTHHVKIMGNSCVIAGRSTNKATSLSSMKVRS